MVCPELLTHVKSEVERDAALAKNLRKAREERELQRKKKGGKGARMPREPALGGIGGLGASRLLLSPCKMAALCRAISSLCLW